MSLFSFLDALFSYDSTAASTGSSDSESSRIESPARQPMADWQNGFGTACDLQVPAESTSAFQSNDWSTFNDPWKD
jgi:hypothetical protein